MKSLSPELIDALAVEYVLGTQSPPIRRRIARLLEQESELQDRVSFWQNNIDQLGELAKPVPVPPWVWRRIESELQPTSEKPDGWWRNVLVWRWTTGLATAMAILLTLLPPVVERPDAMTIDGGVVLVLADDSSKTAFLVSRQSEGSPIKAQALAVPVITLEQAYELWLIPADGVPLSVGLLNDQGGTLLELNAVLNQLLEPGVGMAVSLEPPGGSPTGAPTGPIVYSGSVLSL